MDDQYTSKKFNTRICNIKRHSFELLVKKALYKCQIFLYKNIYSIFFRDKNLVVSKLKEAWYFFINVKSWHQRISSVPILCLISLVFVVLVYIDREIGFYKLETKKITTFREFVTGSLGKVLFYFPNTKHLP